jgi:TolB-like protein/class 3 adenylate cyclase
MATARVERRLAAILMADVVGYSTMIEQDEAGTLAALSALRHDVIEPLLAEHRGRLVKLLGDGVLAEFGSVVDAAAFAVDLQRQSAARQAGIPPGKRIVLRIGINLGDVVVEDGDLLGHGVNVAARLEQLCQPGGVLVSGAAYDHLQGKFALPLEFAGEQAVKNIAGPVRVYRISIDGTRQPWRLRYRPIARQTAWIGALAALVAAAAIAWVVLARSGGPDGTSGVPTIAVLPFDDLGGQSAPGYFGDGVAEDIIAMLSRVPELKVLARSSSFAQRDASGDVRAVGKALGASHLLQGSVRKEADRVRIIAQLVDTASGEQVWAERFDRSGTDPWALQDQVTERIVADLVGDFGTLKLAQYRGAWGKDSTGLQEYDYYLRAQDLVRQLRPEGNEEARAITLEGLSKYPDSPLLKLELAYTYFLQGWNAWGGDLPAQYRRAGELVKEARAEPALSPLERRLAHFLSAFVDATEREFERGLREAEAAIALSPYDVYMLASLSQISVMAGKPAQALEWIERASLLDTNPDISQELAFYRGWALHIEGKLQEALAALDEDRRSDTFFTPLVKAIVLKRLGRLGEAVAALKKGLVIEPTVTQAMWRELFFYSDPSIIDGEVADLASLGLPP